MRVSGCDKDPQAKQLSVFRSHLSLEMISVLTYALNIPVDTDKTVDAILAELRTYIRGQKNIAVDRVAFEERVQERGKVLIISWLTSRGWQRILIFAARV